MRRWGLNLGVSIAALALGIWAFLRGQNIVGVCFVLLGVLRGLLTVAGRRRGPPKPSVRLHLDDSEPK